MPRDEILVSTCAQLALLLQKAPERRAWFLASEGPVALLELLGSASSKVLPDKPLVLGAREGERR